MVLGYHDFNYSSGHYSINFFSYSDSLCVFCLFFACSLCNRVQFLRKIYFSVTGEVDYMLFYFQTFSLTKKHLKECVNEALKSPETMIYYCLIFDYNCGIVQYRCRSSTVSADSVFNMQRAKLFLV